MAYVRSYLTHLRVFEPVASHPEFQDMPREDNRARVLAALDADADRRLLRLPVDPVPAPGPERAIFLPAGAVGDGIDRVCPVQEELRSWLAMDQLDEEFSSLARSMILPEPARRRASSARTLALHDEDDVRVHIRQAAWELPPMWLIAVVPGQDQVAREGDAMVVRAPVLAASARTEWAAEVLERHLPQDGITAEMRDLADWLDSFDLNAVVELDYGGFSDLIWPDDSATLVDSWVDAVEAGDKELAVTMRRDYAQRWVALNALAQGS